MAEEGEKPRRSARGGGRRAAPATTVRLRLYAHGLGDCILVELPRRGGPPFRLLIDCGVHGLERGGPAIVRAVAADLAAACEGRLDAIAGTHEHWDHLSGFLLAQDIFRTMEIGEIWMSWAEDPADPLARELDRFKADGESLLMGLRLAVGAGPEADALDPLLGFVLGAGGERVRAAREALRALGRPIAPLLPGRQVPLPADVPDIRIHVLGPPRDRRRLLTHDTADSYRLGFSAAPDMLALETALAVQSGRLRLRDDPAAPFDDPVGVPLAPLLEGRWEALGAAPGAAEVALARLLDGHYLTEPEAGGADAVARATAAEAARPRRIDEAFAAEASALALRLDSNTNNTSLVLAIEIVSSGRVLLFAADAQAGNWESWPELRLGEGADAPSGADLLARTVFYKVGHHGSRNGTPMAGGLERMRHGELVAFNPVRRETVARARWNDFPAAALVERLRRATDGRYVEAGDSWITDGSRPPIAPGGALRALRSGRIAVPGVEAPVGWVEMEIG